MGCFLTILNNLKDEVVVYKKKQQKKKTPVTSQERTF